MANLRDFRKRVAALKRQGLLPERTTRGNKIDARSADPGYKVGKTTLGKLVEKYDDVASGKVTALKVPPKKLREFKKAGYETAKGRVLIPHSANEKVKLVKGEVTIKARGITRVQIPVPFETLPQYLTDIQKKRKSINRTKKPNESFGFRFFGNNSSELHSDIGTLIEFLEGYQTVIEANSRYKQLKVYKNLEIVTVDNIESPNWFGSRTRREVAAKVNAKRQKKFRARLKNKGEGVRAKYKKATAERMRKYRARIVKGNGNRLRKFRKQARIRAQKSREKTKKKKK